MKQVLQSPASGAVEVRDLPSPRVLPGTVVVRNEASLISVGTERTAMEFGQKSLVGKARSRPDLVRKVLQKVETDGALAAFEAARSRLDQPLALGYSCAGTVVEVGPDVSGFAVGDRVACAGAGHASHAELVRVSVNLVAPVPEGVPLGDAAFATVGSIALHGFRLAEPTLGETVGVIGLGLIGLLASQIARAAGCRVLGVDLDPARLELARSLGIDVAVRPESAEDAAAALSDGNGLDAVLIAAASDSTAPLHQAVELSRDRGRVIMVGAVGMELDRRPFFEKEVLFRVSRSYGPGRYDPTYEEEGVDYPIGFVRWTENRNLRAVLDLLQRGTVQVEPLVTHRFPVDEAEEAYRLITAEGEAPLGVLLEYPEREEEERREPGVGERATVKTQGEIGVGLLGAGGFAVSTLLPALAKVEGLRRVGVCTTSGPSADHVARKFGFGWAATEEARVFDDPQVDLLVIATPHHLHADQIARGLSAGKHVFCEKPPALDREGLERILSARAEAEPRPVLAVGYNRRFAPMAARMREHFAPVEEPLLVHYRVNAGAIPLDHWIHDPAVGGGRIVGEVCHFVDFASFLTSALPMAVRAVGLPDGGRYRDDNVAVTIRYEDGSVAEITYLANGSPRLAKERVEASGGGRSAVLDNFRRLELLHGSKRSVHRHRLRQEKGHREEMAALARAVRDGADPIPLQSLVATSLVTFAAVESLRSGEEVALERPSV